MPAEVDCGTAPNIKKISRGAQKRAPLRGSEAMVYLGQGCDGGAFACPVQAKRNVGVVQVVTKGLVKAVESRERVTAEAHIGADEFQCVASVQVWKVGRFVTGQLFMGFGFSVNRGNTGLIADAIAPAYIADHGIRVSLIEGDADVNKETP